MQSFNNYLKARFGLICLLFFAFTLAARADILTCDVCGKPMFNFYEIEDKIDGKMKKICEECEKTHAHCYLCGLPVREGFKELTDGRFICARELQTVVQADADALQICAGVKDGLDRQLSRFMTFPGDNVLLSVVDKYRLENLFSAPGSDTSFVEVYGATVTRSLGEHKFAHTVDVLSYLQKPRLMAVTAHELTHTWIGENVTRQRQQNIDKDTLEAFCELVAYKYMENLHEDEEMKSIKKNHYTRGQINMMLAADSRFGFNTVVDWMKDGEDPRVDIDNLDRIRALKDHVAPKAVDVASALVYGNAPIAAPTTLVLKSISGSDQRRFAMINSTTFEANEKSRVRVGTNNLSVQCLTINKDSVIIQVDGSPEKKQLFLRTQ